MQVADPMASLAGRFQKTSPLAADLSPSAVIERQRQRDLETEGDLLRAKATRKLKRAGRLPLGSNGREKLDREAARLLMIADALVAG